MTYTQRIITTIIAVVLMATTTLFLSQMIGHNVAFGDSVTVSASVSETVTCSTNVSSTDFGTLSSGSITTASPNATTTVSCNSAGGCTLNVSDAGDGGSNAGLYNSTTTEIIASQTATLSAGTEGYGIQAASSSAGTGGNLEVSSVYDKTSNDVGALQTSNTQIASSTEPISSRELAVTHKAAISGTTASGVYQDTITYSCTAN